MNQCKFCDKNIPKSKNRVKKIFCDRKCFRSFWDIGKFTPLKNCPFCKRIFVAMSISRKEKFFCSTKCSRNFNAENISKKRKTRIKKTCEICEKEFEKRPCEVRIYKKNFCSRKCLGIWCQRTFLKQHELKPLIKKEDKSSYLHRKYNGKRKLVHRHIMEQYLGRELEKNEHVHHINGVKNDNRIENLQVMKASDHLRLEFYLHKINTHALS